MVKDLVDRGGVGFTYRVVVKPVETAFQLALDDEQVAIPRGGVALIPVTVTRAGYDGPIALDVLGVPAGAGVTVLPGTVPAGQTGGVVGLKADGESPFDACGSASGGQGSRRPGRRGVQDDRLRAADDHDARLRHVGDDPELREAARQPHRRR